MFSILCFVLLNCLVYLVTAAEKSKSVNLNLETVMEFDKKNLDSDVKIIDNVQKFLSKVRNALDKTKNYRRSFANENLKFSDFIEKVLSIVITYSDDQLEELIAVVDEELRKYHYKGCKFYELVQNNDLRRIIGETLEELKRMSARKIRKMLERYLKKLHNRNLIERDMDILNYIDSLYIAEAKEKMYDFLDSFENFSNSSQRKHVDLVEIIRNGIRTVIFDHYSNLNPNARKDLRLKIAIYLMEFSPEDDSTTSSASTIGAKSTEIESTTKNKQKLSYKNSSLDAFTPAWPYPLKDMDAEKKRMPFKFISLYTAKTQTVTPKLRDKKKKSSRNQKHKEEHMPLVIWEPRPKTTKKYKERMVIKRPRTVMVVKEDRPLREILTEHNAVIKVESYETTRTSYNLKATVENRKRKISRNFKTLPKDTYKEDPNSSPSTQERNAQPSIRSESQKKQPLQKDMSDGLTIESFENNVLDGHFVFRKQNLKDNFDKHKQKDKRPNKHKSYLKFKDDLKHDLENKHQQTGDELVTNVRNSNTDSEDISMEKDSKKLKKHKHGTTKHNKKLSRTQKESKKEKRQKPIFRSKLHDDTIETKKSTTVTSDDFIIKKIHSLEKQLEDIINKIDNHTETQKNITTTVSTTENTPPIVIVNRAKIYEDIDTTPKNIPIPYWAGTVRTTKLFSGSSSSFEDSSSSEGKVMTFPGAFSRDPKTSSKASLVTPLTAPKNHDAELSSSIFVTDNRVTKSVSHISTKTSAKIRYESTPGDILRVFSKQLKSITNTGDSDNAIIEKGILNNNKEKTNNKTVTVKDLKYNVNAGRKDNSRKLDKNDASPMGDKRYNLMKSDKKEPSVLFPSDITITRTTTPNKLIANETLSTKSNLSTLIKVNLTKDKDKIERVKIDKVNETKINQTGTSKIPTTVLPQFTISKAETDIDIRSNDNTNKSRREIEFLSPADENNPFAIREMNDTLYNWA